MKYKVEGIVSDVRIALDENEIIKNILDDVDTLTLDEIIKQKVLDAVYAVSTSAPSTYLSDAPSLDLIVEWDADGEFHYAPVPDDFLRLVAIRMGQWKVPAVAVVTEGSSLYKQQKSKWKGVRGNYERPVVAIVNSGDGRGLEMYGSYNQSDTVIMAKYIKIPAYEKDVVEICKDVKEAVVYYAAALTVITQGNSQAAEGLFSLSKTYIGG